MKKNMNALMAAGILTLLVSCASVEDITLYAPTETYPNDVALDSVATKKAMIVIAHDDDMSTMSGTISKLNAEGWNIRVISFAITPERDSAQVHACSTILDSVMFYPVPANKIRHDQDTAKAPYRAISTERFPEIFDLDRMKETIANAVNEFQPAVIFSLDNEIGGYGHPDHVMVSQAVLDLATSRTITPQYIYQCVYTDHMENTIMERQSERMKSWGFPGDGWEHAKATYGVSGMPEPTVQISIEDQAATKMAYMRSYNERARKTMDMFIPAFEKYSAEEYFHVFDREFFHVIEFE